jgi:hypothetical protein
MSFVEKSRGVEFGRNCGPTISLSGWYQDILYTRAKLGRRKRAITGGPAEACAADGVGRLKVAATFFLGRLV